MQPKDTNAIPVDMEMERVQSQALRLLACALISLDTGSQSYGVLRRTFVERQWRRSLSGAPQNSTILRKAERVLTQGIT